MSGRGRPMGEIAAALLCAAARSPGTVAQLAERACVGYDAARFKASALVRRGALVPLTDARPRVLAAAVPEVQEPAEEGGGLRELPRGFWAHVAATLAAAGEDGEGDAMPT